MADRSIVPDPATWLPISELVAIADEAFDRWDKDMRSGKLMLALSGDLSHYRGDVTSVRLACAVAPGLLSTLGAVHKLATKEGAFAQVDAETMLRNIREMTAPDEVARMFADMQREALEQRAACRAAEPA